MAANKLNVGMLANVASDGNEGVSDQHVLTYVAANNSVEFKELSLSISGTGTVSSNADSVNTSTVSDINTVQDNVATTLTSLGTANTSIDTVESNLAAFATYANTNYASDAANSFATITVGETNVVASGTSNTLVFTSGNGISVTADAASQAITFDVNIGNVASEYYVLDGTANTVTLTKDNRPANTLYVTVGGLVQEPGINYITASTTLTLINTYPIINGTDVEVRYLPYTGEIFTSGGGGGYSFQGTSTGFNYGGRNGPTSGSEKVQTFSLTSDSSASDAGNLSRAAGGHMKAGKSTTHGYLFRSSNLIVTKASFASVYSESVVGNVPHTDYLGSGVNSSELAVYIGGHGLPSGGPTGQNHKILTSSDVDSVSVGNYAQQVVNSSASNSPTHGYLAGSYSPVNGHIQKFPFSSDTNSIDVGELGSTSIYHAGVSSSTHGYALGGFYFPPDSVKDNMQKYPFSSDTNSTDIGEMSGFRFGSAGISSTTDGYVTGGKDLSSIFDVIDKFSFSSDVDATDVAELSQGVEQQGGAQT
jgi:hypothetical protein